METVKKGSFLDLKGKEKVYRFWQIKHKFLWSYEDVQSNMRKQSFFFVILC